MVWLSRWQTHSVTLSYVCTNRRFLRETLKMSNAEDLNRLTACSLVLLGHIFFVLGNHRVNGDYYLNRILRRVCVCVCLSACA